MPWAAAAAAASAAAFPLLVIMMEDFDEEAAEEGDDLADNGEDTCFAKGEEAASLGFDNDDEEAMLTVDFDVTEAAAVALDEDMEVFDDCFETEDVRDKDLTNCGEEYDKLLEAAVDVLEDDRPFDEDTDLEDLEDDKGVLLAESDEGLRRLCPSSSSL